MKAIKKKVICLVVLFGAVLWNSTTFAYDNYDNWCDSDGIPHYEINTTSFTSRGFSADVVNSIKHASTYWHEPGGDFDAVYQNTTTYCDGNRRICAKYNYEDPVFQQNPTALAYTRWELSWYPWCDFFGLNLHEYWINVNASYNWALTAGQARSSGFYHLPLVMSHEFGHAIGADHTQSTYTKAVMYAYSSPGTGNNTYLQSDDGLGLYANYGKRNEYVKIRSAAPSTNGSLLFYTIYELWGYSTNVRPAIAGNWHQSYLSDTWDYVVAWVSSSDRRVRLTVLKDNGAEPVVLATGVVPNSETTTPPSVTVGPYNTIMVAWRAEGTSNYIKTAITDKYVTSFTSSTLYVEPMSEPVVTYMPGRSRYVMSYVVGTGSYKYRIATRVSANGTSWYAAYTYPGSDPNNPEFVSSPYHSPAIACEGNLSTDTCLLMYTQFHSAACQYIDQQGFQMNAGGDRLDAVTTDYSTQNSTYANLSIAAGVSWWVYSHVENTTDRSKMWYRAKPFWKEVGGDYRYYPTYYQADMLSRVGFPVAYNYKTNHYKFVWTEH